MISEDQLLNWTRYKKAGHLEAWLKKNGIRYFTGCNGTICTTEEAVNEALKSNISSNKMRGTFARTG